MSEPLGAVSATALFYLVPLLVALAVTRIATLRARRIRRWAAEHGWEVREEDGALTAFVTSLLGGPRSGRHRQLADDVLIRTVGDVRAYSFTYRWQARDDVRDLVPSASRQRRTSHVVAVPLDRDVSMVQVTPEGAASILAKAVGAQDLQFESHAFNRAFRIVADDPRVAHAVLHPRLMETLLDGPGRRTSWRIEHGWVLAWVDGRTAVAQILPMLEVVTAVRSSLPSFVGNPVAPAPVA